MICRKFVAFIYSMEVLNGFGVIVIFYKVSYHKRVAANRAIWTWNRARYILRDL